MASVYSDEEEILPEHFGTVGLAVACSPLVPFFLDEDLRPEDLTGNARAMASWPGDSRSEESRFILSSSAACHISSERSDFKTLTPILPHPVKDGLTGACFYAMGRGTIDVHTDISAGRKLTLQNVLFVPFARARLISVHSLGRDYMYACHFGPKSCWITDKSGIIVARGTRSLRDLYVLSINVPISTHFELASLQQEHTHTGDTHVSRTPDIETWHRRLGHCDVRIIIDMARNHAVNGMTIDLPIAPLECANCIFGKQACLPVPVPGELESVQAKRPLERVYMHLWGPMSVTSQSGRLFAMVFVDDFSSYAWAVPLRSKDDAAKVLPAWKCAVENGSEHRLKTLVAKDGQFSQSMLDWCALHNIEHRVSAHNGRTTRQSKMILGNSRAMMLACNAPRSLWDEFLTTSGYLSTLTGSNNLDGKTPYELWNGWAPSLSHLREIGCLAFALVATVTQNPKTYQYSEPCILIGYEPRAKEYRLWDPATGKVFKSPRVLFVERLDTVPTHLEPGATFSIVSTAALPSWDAPVSAAVFTVSAAKQHIVQV